MDDNRDNAPRNTEGQPIPSEAERVDDPHYNQSGDTHDPSAPARQAEENATKTPPQTNSNGLSFGGEFRVGKITLGLEGDGRLSIRKEGVAEKTLVSEPELEGIFTDHFFTREYGNSTSDADSRRADLAAKPHSN